MVFYDQMMEKKKTKQAHYFSAKQDSTYTEQTIIANLRKRTFTFTTSSGVFSVKKVDKGTELLINHAEIPKDAQTIVDLGCGYGPVGIVMAKCFPEKQVVLLDVNERAVKLARKNIKQHKLENAIAKASDGFAKVKESFDVILLNPPQTAGKKVCERLIKESYEHLTKNGTLQMVARHQKGGKTLSQYMENLFGNMKEGAKGSGYRIYTSVKEK